ncbi:MAG: hypothetical protein AAF564_05600 [Bacteroidota bacterium]
MLGDKILIKPEYYALARTIFSTLEKEPFMQATQRCVIGIGGESGSGKSVTATCLRSLMDEQGIGVHILHQDDYFILPPLQNHLNRKADLKNVGMHEVDTEKLQHNIDSFLAGAEAVQAPLVDFNRDTITHRTFAFDDAQVLIVEGTYVLALQNLNARIFLSRNYEDTRHLRTLRNRDTHVEADFIDRILEIEHQIISQFADTASMVIDKSYRIKGNSSVQPRAGLS